MLEVKEVSKLYENQRGVNHIDFSMSRGEIVGFLGPNGAGKTTTMRMITGYLNPTKGSIYVDGLSMADHPGKARKKIGYLPETPPLYPDLSVRSYLKFVADLRDVPVREQKQRIGEVMERLGLKGRENQIIRSLSKGYKQRLGLAQAIVHQPDLLILDEPTSGLDPKQIIEIRQLIRELGENHTVLLSTHILPEVNAICNRVLIINGGRIVLDEAPERLSQTMSDTFQVKLEVRGPKALVIGEIQGIPEVASVTELETERVALTELGTKRADQLEASASAAEREQTPASTGTAASEGAVSAAETSSDTVKLLVSAKDRSDFREALFFRLAQAGYPILEMKKEMLSLEDIFLKLTTEESADARTEEVKTDA